MCMWRGYLLIVFEPCNLCISLAFSLSYAFLFRIAKKKMDEQSFFGGLLHVCYAPEFETVEETRKKLEERKAYISRVTKNQGMEIWKVCVNNSCVSGTAMCVCHCGIPTQSRSSVT